MSRILRFEGPRAEGPASSPVSGLAGSPVNPQAHELANPLTRQPGNPPTGQPANTQTRQLADRSSEAFGINFARGRTLPASVRRALAWLALAYVLANLVIGCALLGLTVLSFTEAQRVRQLAGASLNPAAQRVAQQEMADLQAQAGLQATQLNAIIERLARRLPAAGKLAVLASTLPARTWITGLDAKREGHTLTIKATYLIDPEHPYELPTTAWVGALKSDARFGQGLKRLELQNSSRKTVGRAELFEFTLAAEWGPLS